MTKSKSWWWKNHSIEPRKTPSIHHLHTNSLDRTRLALWNTDSMSRWTNSIRERASCGLNVQQVIRVFHFWRIQYLIHNVGDGISWRLWPSTFALPDNLEVLEGFLVWTLDLNNYLSKLLNENIKISKLIWHVNFEMKISKLINANHFTNYNERPSILTIALLLQIQYLK